MAKNNQPLLLCCVEWQFDHWQREERQTILQTRLGSLELLGGPNCLEHVSDVLQMMQTKVAYQVYWGRIWRPFLISDIAIGGDTETHLLVSLRELSNSPFVLAESVHPFLESLKASAKRIWVRLKPRVDGDYASSVLRGGHHVKSKIKNWGRKKEERTRRYVSELPGRRGWFCSDDLFITAGRWGNFLVCIKQARHPDGGWTLSNSCRSNAALSWWCGMVTPDKRVRQDSPIPREHQRPIHLFSSPLFPLRKLALGLKIFSESLIQHGVVVGLEGRWPSPPFFECFRNLPI